MLRQVEVRTTVNTFHFLEAERHQEFDIRSSIGIVSQLVMVVIAIMIIAEAQCLMPFQTGLFPSLEPVEFSTRFYKELHLHLLKLTHTEDELACNDFVTESLTDLCDTERNLHTTGLLYIQIVHEDTLSCFRTKVNLHCTFRSRTHFSGKHQIELANFRPVFRTADRANNFLIQYNLAQFIKVIIIQCFGKTFVQSVTFSLMLQHAGICTAKLCFIKSFTETFGSFGNFFVYFVVIFGELIFNQHIGTITFLGIAVINQRIIERIYVSACLPDCGMHKDSRVNAYYILVQQHHTLPPVLFDVIFQFHTHLTIIIYGSQTVIDVAGREHKSVFLAV